MKKLLIILILMLCALIPQLNNQNVYAETETVKVIYTKAYVFSEPESIEENIVTEYSYGTKLSVIESEIRGEDYLYYKIKINDVPNITEGYIRVSHVIDAKIFIPQKELDTNATIKGKAEVYSEPNDTLKIDELIDGTKIRLISGYRESEKYSKIQYLNQDGEIITAYIKTSNIQVSHISRVLIGVIIITVTSVSIILILCGVKKSRKGGIKKIFKKNRD